MGLGKSRQALGIIDYYKDDWPVLIITNASTREFWANQIFDLLPKVLFTDVYIIQNQKDYLGREKIIIGSYSNIQGNIDEMINKNFGIIVFDESHSIKNSVIYYVSI